MKMRTKWVAVAATGSLAALVVLLGPAMAQEQRAAAPGAAPANVRSAVCNAYEVIQAYQPIVALGKTLEQESEPILAEKDRRVKEIEALQATLKTLRPDSGAFADTVSQLDERRASLKVWEELQTVQAKRRVANEIERAYARMHQALADIADEQGFHLVLNRTGEPNLAGREPDDMQSRILTQRVLHYDPSVDITALVIDRMNALAAGGSATQASP